MFCRFAFLFCLFTFLSVAAFSQQNLVPNPSFEADSSAPIIQKYNWRRYANWQKDSLSDHNKYILTRSWSQPTGGTPDYLNSYRSSLFGFQTQTARTGRGRFGLICGITKNSFNTWLLQDGNYAEYLETVLTQPLVAGKLYCVRYYVSLDKRSHFAANDFGAIVSSTAINSPDYRGSLDYNSEGTPHLDNNNHYITSDEGWVMICDTFIAKGGERFLTIGSFMSDFAKNRHEVKPELKKGLRWMPNCKYAYYYVDDVSLTEVQPNEQLCVSKDTVARNNIVILVDVSGSMEQKKFIDSVKIATLQFVNTLNPSDLISIIAFRSDTQLLVSCRPARDTAYIRNSFNKLITGGATNIGLAIEGAYAQVRKGLLPSGNNKIILITDGRVHISKEIQASMEESSSQGIDFSIIFLGEKVPDDMVQLAEDLHGTFISGPPSMTAEAMTKEVPASAVKSEYGTKKVSKIILWHVMTKVFFPVIFIGMLLVKIGTMAL